MLQPHIGLVANLYLTQDEINEIESQRVFFSALPDASHLHEGHALQIGLPVAAIVAATRVDDGRSLVNVRVLTDGTDLPWLRNIDASRLYDPNARIEEDPHRTVDRLWPIIAERLRNKLQVSVTSGPQVYTTTNVQVFP